MDDRKISILVDEQPAAVRGARSQVEEFLASRTRQVIDFGVETLKTQVENTLGSILDILGDIDLHGDEFEIGSVSFTLSINAEGKISVVSVASGTIASHTGLTFTLIYKGKK